MSLESYEFKDPGRLIEEIAQRVALADDTVYVALVRHPATEQCLTALRRMNTPALIDDYFDACKEVRETMRGFAVPDQPRPPQHAAITVVVRSGLCVFGPNEGEWLKAWRYSNHLTNAYDGGVILVTEHGWLDLMTDCVGLSPALAA
jgi:hypothetical protein